MKKLALVFVFLLLSSFSYGETFYTKWFYNCPDYEVRFDLYMKDGDNFKYIKTMENKCTEAGEKSFNEDFSIDKQFRPGDNVVFGLLPVNQDGVIAPSMSIITVSIAPRGCPAAKSFGVWLKE